MKPPASILVVDDDEDNCANLRDILADLGYDVETALDGTEALDKLAGRAFTVALLDLKMPGMDGLTLVRAIKQRSPRTESLLVTAFATSQVEAEARAAGAARIVNKPIDLPELLGFLREHGA